LYRWAVLFGKCLHGNASRSFPCIVKFWSSFLNGRHACKGLPGPSAIHICAQDSVPNLRKRCEFVSYETMELRAGALQDQQAIDATANCDTVLRDLGLNCANFGAIAVEGVWVWLSVNCHSCPSVCDHADVRGVDVCIFLDKVSAQVAGIELRRSDWVLFSLDVNGVLD
jgi:hypothetical protein